MKYTGSFYIIFLLFCMQLLVANPGSPQLSPYVRRKNNQQEKQRRIQEAQEATNQQLKELQEEDCLRLNCAKGTCCGAILCALWFAANKIIGS